MSTVKVESVVKESAVIGEGPVWEESEQTLLFVDIIGEKIHRWSPATNQIQSMKTGDTVGFAVPRRSGGYVAGVGRKIVAVDWSSQTMTTLVEVDKDKPSTRLNDGKVDPVGRLLAGTMDTGTGESGQVKKKQGSLYALNSDLTLTKHLSQVDISNGLDWSLDQKTFYYIDSLSLNVDAFDYDPVSGTLVNRRVVHRLEDGDGLPDGMTVDSEGRLWVACYNGGQVIHIDPETGVRLQTVSFPAAQITSCCFGGPGYSQLFVTSGSTGLNQQPQAGHTFRVTGLGVKGRPSQMFSG